MGVDYREFGFTADVIHSASLVAELTRTMAVPGAGAVTFHDPCYLGRYAGVTEEPRDLLARFGAQVGEPERYGANPFCCGAGGGLLFEEHEEGRRISQERFEQLQRTGAATIVTACPFCSIMLKGAQASAHTQVEFVDLMSFVDGRMKSAAPATAPRP
jgi:Fe-S oxidoreductase